MTKGAIFDFDRKYRYVLYRIWDESKPKAMCIGLNPSTADSNDDDPTIRWTIRALTDLGYGSLYMTNLFGLISSTPYSLTTCPDPIKDNDQYLEEVSLKVDTIIFCWGAFKQAVYRAKKMKDRFHNPQCFGKTKNGSPWHPLAMMYGGVKEFKLQNFNS